MTTVTRAAQDEAAAFFAQQYEPIPGVATTITDHGTYTRAWCRELIARGEQAGPMPRFGSPAWCQLPGGDPRKIGALVRAALAWYREGEDLPLSLAQDAHARWAEEEAYWRWSGARRRDLAQAAIEDNDVAHRRRAWESEMEDRARTGRDYPGGGLIVDWEPAHAAEGASA